MQAKRRVKEIMGKDLKKTKNGGWKRERNASERKGDEGNYGKGKQRKENGRRKEKNKIIVQENNW